MQDLTPLSGGKLSFKVAAGGVAAFGIERLVKSFVRRKHHERLPLGIFLELERQASSEAHGGE